MYNYVYDTGTMKIQCDAWKKYLFRMRLYDMYDDCHEKFLKIVWH